MRLQFICPFLFCIIACAQIRNENEPFQFSPLRSLAEFPTMRIFPEDENIKNSDSEKFNTQFKKYFRVIDQSDSSEEIVDINLFMGTVHSNQLKNGVENWIFLDPTAQIDASSLKDIDTVISKNAEFTLLIPYTKNKKKEFFHVAELDGENFSTQIRVVYDSYVERRPISISKSFYINLDRSTDRKKFMEKQNQEYGLNLTRFPAVDGSVFKNQYIVQPETSILQKLTYGQDEFLYNYRKDHYGKGMTFGEIGNFLSLFYIMKTIVEDNYPITLILEDDAKIPKNFNAKIGNYLKKAPKNWDIIYLYCNSHESFGCNYRFKKTRDGLFSTLSGGSCVAGMVAAVLSQKGARKIHRQLLLPISRPVDMLIGNQFMPQKLDEFSAFCTTPELVTTGDLGSEIKGMGREH